MIPKGCFKNKFCSGGSDYFHNNLEIDGEEFATY